MKRWILAVLATSTLVAAGTGLAATDGGEGALVTVYSPLVDLTGLTQSQNKKLRIDLKPNDTVGIDVKFEADAHDQQYPQISIHSPEGSDFCYIKSMEAGRLRPQSVEYATPVFADDKSRFVMVHHIGLEVPKTLKGSCEVTVKSPTDSTHSVVIDILR